MSQPTNTLQRQRYAYRRRHVAFWRRDTGQLISDHGDGATIPPNAPLSWVLHLISRIKSDLRPRVLYIMGGEHAGSRPRMDWWAEPVGGSWDYDGYELAGSKDRRGGTYDAGSYSRGDCTVDVRMSAVWFGEALDPHVARDAWANLCDQLATAVKGDPHATLLTTPASTGADLLKRWLPAGRAPHQQKHSWLPIEYDPIPPDVADILYHNVGQGRMEFCPPPDLHGELIAGLWTLDAVWMYASCVNWLPVGPVEHQTYHPPTDHVDAYLPFVPAFYRVSCSVPDDWRHLGLIPARAGDTTLWPHLPGTRIRDAWVSGVELAVALRAGWRFAVHERIAWPDYQDAPGANPAGDWIRRLRALRSECTEEAYGAAAPLMRHAIRAVQIGAVGQWAARDGERLRITPAASTVIPPGGRLHHLDRAAGVVLWYERKPLSAAARPLCRPEWSATVWSRARAKLNDYMLTVPRRQLVALRSDAIVVCEPPTGLPDSVQPGQFRVKWSESALGPFVMPQSADRMLQLRQSGQPEQAATGPAASFHAAMLEDSDAVTYDAEPAEAV